MDSNVVQNCTIATRFECRWAYQPGHSYNGDCAPRGVLSSMAWSKPRPEEGKVEGKLYSGSGGGGGGLKSKCPRQLEALPLIG